MSANHSSPHSTTTGSEQKDNINNSSNELKALFKIPEFRWFIITRFTSTLAAQIQSVAIAWQVYALTNSAAQLGFVGLAIFLPFFLTSFYAGDFVDRVNRLKILKVVYLVFLSISFVFVALNYSNHISLQLVFFLLAGIGITRAFLGASAGALLPNIVPSPLFVRAVAINSTVWQISNILGPIAGGLLFTWKGALSAHLACFILFALASYTIHRINVTVPLTVSPLKMFQRLTEGLRFILKKKIILGALSLDLFAVLLGGAVALLPIFAKDILHTGPWGLGVLRASPSIGAALMAVVFTYRPPKRRIGHLLFGGVFIFGLATCVFALSKNLILSIIALGILGSVDMISVIIRQSLVQINTPDNLRGRVMSVNQVFIGASNELGEFESGLTAHWWGAIPAAFIGGCATCAIALIWMRLFPALRRAETLQISDEPKSNRP